MWCLISLAILAALGALGALFMRPSRLHLPRPRPSRLLRGCLALLFLMLAALLGLLAFLLVNQA